MSKDRTLFFTFAFFLPGPEKVSTKQKIQHPVRMLDLLVGAGGFEPPKLKSSRFTVCPHWPLGNTPRFNFYSHS